MWYTGPINKGDSDVWICMWMIQMCEFVCWPICGCYIYYFSVINSSLLFVIAITQEGNPEKVSELEVPRKQEKFWLWGGKGKEKKDSWRYIQMFSLFSIRPLMPTVKNVLSPTNFHMCMIFHKSYPKQGSHNQNLVTKY